MGFLHADHGLIYIRAHFNIHADLSSTLSILFFFFNAGVLFELQFSFVMPSVTLKSHPLQKPQMDLYYSCLFYHYKKRLMFFIHRFFSGSQTWLQLS